MHQGRADQANSLAVHKLGSSDSVEFLIVNVLLSDAGAASAVLLWILNRNQSGGVHFLVPGQTLLPFLTFLVGEEFDREGGLAMVAGQVGCKTLAELTPKIFVFVTESEVHFATSPSRSKSRPLRRGSPNALVVQHSVEQLLEVGIAFLRRVISKYVKQAPPKIT